MYYKKVPMSLQEAVSFEAIKGFDTPDEFREVMLEIADLYDVSVGEVYRIFYNLDIKVEA